MIASLTDRAQDGDRIADLAWQRLAEARAAHPELPGHLWQIAEATANTLAEWHLPAGTVAAALLAPLLTTGLVGLQALVEPFGPQVASLAERLAARAPRESVLERAADPTPAQYQVQLRSLFRDAYLDAPGLPWSLMLMADHDARLTAYAHDARLAGPLAAETMHVFVPLAEMLGTWQIRRKWLDLAWQIQQPRAVAEMLALLGAVEDYTEEGFARVVGHAAQPAGNGNGRSKMLLGKARAYFQLRDELLRDATAQHMEGRVCISPIMPSIGSILQQSASGLPKDELAGRLQVRLICNTEQDCYAALGLAHRRGKPVARRFKERFDDFIAMPNPSGYRALHTAIIYQGSGTGENGEGQMLAEFRILTDTMDRLNMWGVVEGAHRAPQVYAQNEVWWNRLDNLSRHLQVRYQMPLDVQAFVRQHEPGTRSQPIYVFTPRGEIVLLDEDSTPVDLAYRIHTELGHHAASIQVNGLLVPHHYPLHNGDLVRIKDDPNFNGPDLSWLSFAAMSATRTKIRRGLRNSAGATHEGRNRIVELLMRATRSYWSKRKYRLGITTPQLDDYLQQVARARGLPGLQALYDEVAAERIMAANLVRQLISEHLGGSVMRLNGERLPYAPHNITLCDVCQPVPGQAIVGVERRSGVSNRGLMVHRQDNESGCPSLATSAGARLAVRWAEPVDALRNESVLLEISAMDRRQLLGDILEAVYAEPGAQLLKVDAQASMDNSAVITVGVEAANYGVLAHLQSNVSAVHGVRRVIAYPLDTAQLYALKPQGGGKRLPNPYTIGQEVYSRTAFYDRERPISDIMGWLQEPLPSTLMILHGQRRVGKSSLARHLMHEVLPMRRVAHAVYITFQGFSGFTADTMANYLVQATCNQLKRDVPAREPWEEPVPWLSRVLEATAKQLGNYRLLLILDEFDALVKREQEGKLDALFFSNLRAIINERRDVNWMLIVQDNYFIAPNELGSAGMLLQQARDLGLANLEPRYATKLITEPAKRCGIEYEEALVEKIMELTAGNPYLIQLLCYKLVQRVRIHDRANITLNDLEETVTQVTMDGARHFDHFVGNLTGIPKIMLAAIASSAPEGQSVELQTVIADLQLRAKWLRAKALRNATETLIRQGMIEPTGSQGRVRLPVRLFHRHVRGSLDVEAAVLEYRLSRAAGASRENE